MAMTIVEGTRAITGGVDTHLEVHVAAALDPVGGLLGVNEFPTSQAGEVALLAWLASFGRVELVGVEGTGSSGASLGRFLAAAGVEVVEVVGRTVKPGTGAGSRIRWMRSKLPAPRKEDAPRVRPRAATARWKRSGR